MSPEQNLADFTVPIEQAAAECFRAARHTGGRFGAWYYILRVDGSVVSGQDWVLGRNGVEDSGWLDRINAYTQVLHILDSARDQALADGKSVWRVLLMAGDDSGAFTTHMVFDDDPALDEWDFDPVKGLNLVNKTMPLLDIWPRPATPTEHVQTICTPFRDAARRTATKNFGTAYAVIDLTDPEQPVLRSQIRKADGTTVDDWVDPDTTAIVAHHAAAYRRYYVDNDYPDWTQAAIAAKDTGPLLAKAIDTNPNTTDPDPTELIDHIIDTLNL